MLVYVNMQFLACAHTFSLNLMLFVSQFWRQIKASMHATLGLLAPHFLARILHNGKPPGHRFNVSGCTIMFYHVTCTTCYKESARNLPLIVVVEHSLKKL